MDNKVTSEDMEKAMEIFQDIKSKCDDVNKHVSNIIKSVEDGDVQTAKGISFLEVKNQMMLSYLTNLTHLMCDKIHGKSIKDHPSTDRLIEIRTVIEKMRPIDQKLKYQIDKLVKTATTGIGEDDPLKFKPNIDGLVSKLDEEDEGSEPETGEGESSTAKYRPPKMAAMPYEDDKSQSAQQSKVLERAKKRALSSSIMRDLKDQYSEAPEEVRDDYNYHRVKVDKASKERQEYEEKYFLRMQVSKKELHAARKLRTMSGLNEITHFGDMSALTGRSGNADGDNFPSKKRKMSAKGKGGKKGSKKRRKIRH